MINTNNFFKRNTSIRNPAAPYKKGKFVDESPEYKSRVFSRVQESPLTKTLLSMRKNVLGIENALRGLFELDKKKQATDQKFDLAEKQEAKDKPKVKPKTPKIFGNIIERPKTGVLDAIKNFVTFTFLGWLFTRLQPFIDRAGGLVPLLENIMKFFSGLIVGTLNAFASFLKFGYDAKDTFDLKIKEIKKETEGISKHFDNTLGELKTVFSGAIEVVNSFLNTSVDEEELKTARQDSPETNIPPLPKLPDNKTVAPSLPVASNINGDSPIGKAGPQSAPMSTTSPTIYKVNTGGRIDPTKTPITRGTEQKEKRVIRRKPDIQQQKTVPGKDVGGEDKVKQVYGEETGSFKPDFIPNSIFFRTETKSGYAGLLKAAEEYKRPNDKDVLGLGNLMGATVDTALGQKLERRSITQFADGIRYLVDQGMSNPEEFKKIDLELMIRRIVEPKIEAAINKIRDEVNKKSKERPTDGGLDGGGGIEGGVFGAVSGNEYERAFLDLIAQAEGTSKSYGTVFGGAINKDLESGKLTVKEAIDLGNSATTGSGATGRYQFMPNTLIGLVDRGVLKINEKFTPEKQDQAAIALARGRGVDPSKPLSIRDMYRLGGEWASIEGGPQMRKGGAYGFRGSSQVKYSGERALEIYNKKLEMARTSVAVGVPPGTESKAKYLIVMSGRRGYRQVLPGESAPTDFLHHGREDIRRGLIVRDYGITPKVHGGSQLLEGEGVPVVVPFGMRAKAVVQGRHSIRFLDPNSNKTIAVYHHLDNIPSSINGKILSGGAFIGTQGGRPGSSSGYGRSSAVHVHLEATPEWHRAFIRTYAGGLNVPKNAPPIINTPTPNIKKRNVRGGGSVIVEPQTQSSTLNIRPPSPILPEQKYASYNDPTAQRTIATIQPIIIEKPPVSTGSGSVIAFATPSVSPNYKSQSLSRS
jgi:muramidase (phage lysozyme)